jgi:hypothetical protein
MYVSTPPMTADGKEWLPVRASGATFVVVGPGPAGSLLPVPPDGSVVAAPPPDDVPVVLDASTEEEDDDEDEEDEDDEVDDDDDDEDDDDVLVDSVVGVSVDVVQTSPLGSDPSAVKVTTTFQNLSPSPVVVAHAIPTL